MDVVAARFTDGGVQEKISNMSERARGLDPDARRRRCRVGPASQVRPRSRRARAPGRLVRGSPGATVQVAGTYGLFTEAMAFDGTVRMKATVSEAAGGGSRAPC